MQRSDLEVITDNVKDVDSSKFFAAINKNNTARLAQIMDGSIKHSKDKIIDGLQMALELKRWNCIKILIAYISKYNLHPKIISKCGDVLIAAAKGNQTRVIKTLAHINHPPGSGNLFYKQNNAFFSKKVFNQDYYGFTALHWAVKNNNPKICEILTQLYKNTLSRHSKNQIDFYKVADKKGQTAFDLAIQLNHIECARAISSHHHWQYIRDHSSDIVIFKILLNDIHFGIYGQYKGPTGIYRKQHDFYEPKSILEINEKDIWYPNATLKNNICKWIKKLPAVEKMGALCLALNAQTPLGNLYSKDKNFLRYFANELKILNKDLENQDIKLAKNQPLHLAANSLFKVESSSPTSSFESTSRNSLVVS